MHPEDQGQRPEGGDGKRARRPLIVNPHKPKSVRVWIIPLILILAVILLLPRLLDLLDR